MGIFRPFLVLAAGCAAAAWTSAVRSDDGFRALAPGVLTVIPADMSVDDPLQRGELVEVTKGLEGMKWVPQRAAPNTTLVQRSTRVEYPRDIWCLEFAFKPPRSITVEVPAGDGKVRRERVLYLVYRVRNVGGRRVRTGLDPDEKGAVPVERRVERFETPVRFLPHFVLETIEGLSDVEGLSAYRAYLDRLVPSAMDAIRDREDPARPLLDSAAMSASELAPGEERWGVAIWEGVDPRIDYFSIFVRGLTNAIRWQQIEGSRIGPDDPPGKHVEQTLKSLRLDFWRPGDAAGEKISVGYRGMFERMVLGGRILTALGWPRQASSQPQIGLERLGMKWDENWDPDPARGQPQPSLREPAGSGGTSLLPLVTILTRVAAIEDPEIRTQVVRDLFGDVGVQAIEELARAAAGPVDRARDPVRRAALGRIGLSPDQVREKPLESLARIARGVESIAAPADRRARADEIFGPAAPRLEWLGKAASLARTLAALDSTDADPRAVAKLDARDAFEAVAAAIAASPEPDRVKLAQGLFGPAGPELLAAALETHEGVNYSWVFRYEE